MPKYASSLIAAAALLWPCVAPAVAAPITFVAEGRLSSTPGAAFNPSLTGAAFRVSYTFDSSSADTRPTSAAVGEYPLVDVWGQVGSVTFEWAGQFGVISIENGAPGFTDIYDVAARVVQTSEPALTDWLGNAVRVDYVGLAVREFNGIMFGNDALPTDPTALLANTSRVAAFVFGPQAVYGEIQTIRFGSARQIDEPHALSLALMGLVALGVVGRPAGVTGSWSVGGQHSRARIVRLALSASRLRRS